MQFKTGDVVKYKEYDPNTMIYYKNFVISRLLFDSSGELILITTNVPIIKDIGIESFNRNMINVDLIELDLEYLRKEKLGKIKSIIKKS